MSRSQPVIASIICKLVVRCGAGNGFWGKVAALMWNISHLFSVRNRSGTIGRPRTVQSPPQALRYSPTGIGWAAGNHNYFENLIPLLGVTLLYSTIKVIKYVL